MTRRFTIVTVGLIATVTFCIGLIVAGSLVPTPAVSGPAALDAPDHREATPVRGDSPLAGAVDFADIADRINPAVVNIEATSRRSDAGRPPLDRDREPSDRFQSPSDGERRRPRHGSGSGVIIEADGHILTNHHVVEGADRIVAKTSDGRTWRATLVGADPSTDLALLKVDASERLPVAPLGDSDTVRVGEWVCAIGNPLAYEHTVTVGVVSYKGRKLFDASLDRYIQTDAAITFGNSGGPLLNARGAVIGINSAISAQASGIGFAVPINQAKAILPQLKRDGRVTRGYVGVTLRDVDPDVRIALDLGDVDGALVQEVVPGSPGERAGLRPYDLILAVDALPVGSNQQLIGEIAGRRPGQRVRLRLLRDGHEQTVTAELTERPSAGVVASVDAHPGEGRRSRLGDALGLQVREIDAGLAERHGIPAHLTGVVIAEVEPLSPAGDAAVQRGSVLLEVNRTPVESVASYRDLTDDVAPGDVLTLYVYEPRSAGRIIHTVRIDDLAR